MGMQNMAHFNLNSKGKVKDKIEMLESLQSIKIATELIDKKDEGNRIDKNYKKLNREIKNVPKDSH